MIDEEYMRACKHFIVLEIIEFFAEKTIEAGELRFTFDNSDVLFLTDYFDAGGNHVAIFMTILNNGIWMIFKCRPSVDKKHINIESYRQVYDCSHEWKKEIEE